MPGELPGVRVMSLVDEGSVLVSGGEIEWVPVRRRLGIGAFGTNAYRARHAGDNGRDRKQEAHRLAFSAARSPSGRSVRSE